MTANRFSLLLVAAALALPSVAQASNFDRHPHSHHHHPMAHHQMMYGHHNHYYHHFYKHPDHHATATGGPAGGIPHRN